MTYIIFISERELSPVRLSACRLSVTFVRPTQAVKIFVNISTELGTLEFGHPLTSTKILRRTPPPVELNTGGVAKYSDCLLYTSDAADE